MKDEGQVENEWDKLNAGVREGHDRKWRAASFHV